MLPRDQRTRTPNTVMTRVLYKGKGGLYMLGQLLREGGLVTIYVRYMTSAMTALRPTYMQVYTTCCVIALGGRVRHGLHVC